MEPKFPNVTIEVVGRDGNAFAILGQVVQALSKSGVPDAEIRQFTEEATAADYDHLLQTVVKWVEVI